MAHPPSQTDQPLGVELAPGETLLTPEELAAILVIPVRTLARWRTQRTGPVPLTIGNHIRYRLVHVNAWLAECEAAAHEWMAS